MKEEVSIYDKGINNSELVNILEIESAEKRY